MQPITVIAVFLASDYRQQAIFLHNTEYCLGIVFHVFQAKYVLFGNRRFCRILPGIPLFFQLTANQKQEYPFEKQSGNIRFLKLQKICTFRLSHICPCDGRLPSILRLFSLPFCEREKIPHQFIFHFQALNLSILACKNIFQLCNLIFFVDCIIFWRSAFFSLMQCLLLISFDYCYIL